MLTFRRLSLGLCGLILCTSGLLACSSSSDDDNSAAGAGQAGSGQAGSGQGANDTYQEFFSSYANALCSVATGCCAADGLSSNPNCESDAVSELQSSLNKEIGTSGELPANVQYNKQKAEQCVTALRALSGTCTATDAAKQASLICAVVISGTVPRGQACTRDIECASTETVRGMCGADLDNPSVHLCKAVGLKKRGEACTGDGANDIDMAVCESGTFCNYTSKVCETDPAVGASCAESLACSNGYCDESSGMCKQPLADGASCQSSNECQSRNCPQGTCAPSPNPGDSCSHSSSNCSCVESKCYKPNSMGIHPACK